MWRGRGTAIITVAYPIDLTLRQISSLRSLFRRLGIEVARFCTRSSACGLCTAAKLPIDAHEFSYPCTINGVSAPLLQPYSTIPLRMSTEFEINATGTAEIDLYSSLGRTTGRILLGHVSLPLPPGRRKITATVKIAPSKNPCFVFQTEDGLSACFDFSA